MTTGGMTVGAKSSASALNFVRGATGPLIGLILLCVFLSVSTDTFLTVRNVLNVMDQVTVLGVMAVGMTLVILIGGIDLSVGSVLALSGMVMGYLGNSLGWPFGIAIAVALSRICSMWRGLRADDHAPEHAGLHRDARDDVDRARYSQHHHERRADRRLPGLVLQPRDYSSLWLPDRNGRGDDCDRRRRLGRFDFPCHRVGRSTPSAAAPRSRVLPASMSAKRRCSFTRFARSPRVLPASFCLPALTLRNQARASATSSTRLPPWSSEAPASPAA